MDRLSPHGIRVPFQPSRRGFLIAMMGAGVMLGYARSGLAAVEFLGSGKQELFPSGTSVGSSAGELFEPTIWYDTDPKWGEMLTGGSWSVWQSFPVLSRAGAAGRIALVEEGAKLLGVSPQICTARNGAVEAKGRAILYGDIVARGDLRRTYTQEQD